MKKYVIEIVALFVAAFALGYFAMETLSTWTI